jgi:hypothetical protein
VKLDAVHLPKEAFRERNAPKRTDATVRAPAPTSEKIRLPPPPEAIARALGGTRPGSKSVPREEAESPSVEVGSAVDVDLDGGWEEDK